MGFVDELEERLQSFVDYVKEHMKEGSEKSHAQIFLDRLFQAFGHSGVLDIGAKPEAKLQVQNYHVSEENHKENGNVSVNDEIQIDTTTKFCDLLWPKKVLIEMKSKKENLNLHFSQAKGYWDILYSDQTEYVVLCNFKEFWIYNWRHQRDRVNKVLLVDLTKDWRAMSFLLPERDRIENKIETRYYEDKVAVTKEAAKHVSYLYTSLKKRIGEEKGQLLSLQCLICLFADSTGLFPSNRFFNELIHNFQEKNFSSYDMLSLLFRRMNEEGETKAGYFKGVKYFDGGIFNNISDIALSKYELKLLLNVSNNIDWSKVSPAIFGNIFEHILSPEEQHRSGAHFTSEVDILRIVGPTLIEPFRKRIKSSKTLMELNNIHTEMGSIKVLDPACGSGNFLFIAYRELKQLELELIGKKATQFKLVKERDLLSKVKGSQFYGIDINKFAVELAKVTLSLAKVLTKIEENKLTEQLKLDQFISPHYKEQAIPFENLDNNFIVADALEIDWIDANIIIGNPPFLAKNKIEQELGPAYMSRIRAIYPDISGFADYCVYWFRKAHDVLKEGGRAGLVGTKTVAETNSLKGGLEYITTNQGIILDAVKSMPWSGQAAVSVAIINWIKTEKQIKKKKVLRFLPERKETEWEIWELENIPATLTSRFDVSKAAPLKIHKSSDTRSQGQAPGNDAFRLNISKGNMLMQKDPNLKHVIFPYLGASRWISNPKSKYNEFVIDFGDMALDEIQRQEYKEVYEIIRDNVLPEREEEYKRQIERNEKKLRESPKARVNTHHIGFYTNWWKHKYSRRSLIDGLSKIHRYIVVAYTGKRPIFDFISSEIRPDNSLIVFLFDDDYSFGILQSSIHWKWVQERGSTHSQRRRYTLTSIYDTMPFPQWGLPYGKNLDFDANRKISLARDVAKKARNFIELRNKIRSENKRGSLREIYKNMEVPGHRLAIAKDHLDVAVRKAYNYGLPKKIQEFDDLQMLFELNKKCSQMEKEGKEIVPPGLPSFCNGDEQFYSEYKVGLNGFESQ